MIQPAAPSVSAKSAPASGAQSGAAGNAPVSSGFAAFLAANQADEAAPAGEADPAASEGAATRPETATGKPTGKPTGKASGNILPDGETAETDAPKGEALAVGKGKSPEGDADPADESSAEAGQAILLALPGAPDPAAPLQLFKPRVAASGKGPSPTKPAPTDAAAQPPKDAADASALQRLSIQPQAAKPAPPIPLTLPESAGQGVGLTLQLREKPTLRPGAVALATQAAAPGSPAAQTAAAQPAIAAINVSMTLTDAPRTATETQPAEPAIAAVDEKPAGAPARSTSAAKRSAPHPEAASSETAAARAAWAGSEPVKVEPAMPRAADLQPVLAVRDAQPSTQAASGAPQTSPTGAIRNGGHDFAALVDRLVEAREAATPQSVKAAITHAEFGKVALRFDQDNGALSVSMTSADPDFAPAVRAAAATAGQASTQGDNGSGAPRHDAPNQQSAGSASGQPQSQGSARGGAREPATLAGPSATNSGPQPGEDGQTPERDGIYA